MPETPGPKRFALAELARVFVDGKHGHPIYGLIAIAIVTMTPVLMWFAFHAH